MRATGVLAALLALANTSLSAHIGRRNDELHKRQDGLDIFGSAAQALGSLRSMFSLLLTMVFSSISDYLTNPGGGAGKVPDPPGALPRRIEMPSDINVAGAKKIKIRNGPYRVPNMGVKSFSGHAGMLEGYLERGVEKPCSKGECSLLRLVGGLEYANGSIANINTGMW
jgi:hypothetical protein